MGRPNTNSVTVAYRLGLPTFRQLKAEALAAQMPVGTYIRQLLQTYAPGKNGPQSPEKASKLGKAAAQLKGL